MLCRQQFGAGFIQRSSFRDHRLRGGESLSGSHLPGPVAQLPVRQTSSDSEQLIFPQGKLHLPGGGAVQLNGEHSAGLAVLQRQEGEVFPHRHGTNVAEPLRTDPVAAPGGLQEQILHHRFFPQFSFRAPEGLEPVNVIRFYVFQRKGGQHFQSDGLLAVVFQLGPYPQSVPVLFFVEDEGQAPAVFVTVTGLPLLFK